MYWGLILIGGVGGAGGGGVSPVPSPPCWDNLPNVQATYHDLVNNIYDIVAESITNAVELKSLGSVLLAEGEGAVNSIQSAESVDPGGLPPFFVGGHFNLDVSVQEVEDALGGYDYRHVFQSDFAGSTSDGVRQPAVTGLAGLVGDTLHSELGPSRTDYAFHFDVFDPLSYFHGGVSWWHVLIGPFGHLGHDVIYGSLFSPCLDPAWNY